MEEKLYTFTEHKIYGHESYNGLNSHQTSTKHQSSDFRGLQVVVVVVVF